MPYLVFMIVYVGSFALVWEFFFNHGGQIIEGGLSNHMWRELWRNSAIYCVIAPMAIFAGLKIGRLTIGGLVSVTILFFVSILILNMRILGQLSVEGLLNYEYWPVSFALLFSYSIMPAIALVVVKYLTRRSSRTRKRAA